MRLVLLGVGAVVGMLLAAAAVVGLMNLTVYGYVSLDKWQGS